MHRCTDQLSSSFHYNIRKTAHSALSPRVCAGSACERSGQDGENEPRKEERVLDLHWRELELMDRFDAVGTQHAARARRVARRKTRARRRPRFAERVRVFASGVHDDEERRKWRALSALERDSSWHRVFRARRRAL
jgi:hypothetical protein